MPAILFRLDCDHRNELCNLERQPTNRQLTTGFVALFARAASMLERRERASPGPGSVFGFESNHETRKPELTPSESVLFFTLEKISSRSTLTSLSHKCKVPPLVFVLLQSSNQVPGQALRSVTGRQQTVFQVPKIRNVISETIRQSGSQAKTKRRTEIFFNFLSSQHRNLTGPLPEPRHSNQSYDGQLHSFRSLVRLHLGQQLFRYVKHSSNPFNALTLI